MEMRTLTIDDYDEMVKLWIKSALPFKPKGRDSRQAIASQMERDPSLFLGAFENSTLVGVIIGSYDHRRKGWINRLAVHPKCRRRSVGQRLITSMEKILKKKDAAVICVLIEETNQESIGLFEKLGYVLERSILYFSKRESEDV
ncbi:GNAT family N-acetyltransferase [Candidatus Bathyarchaeota archaeon]|nr:MAG: GNAT family N-acetyltransferase [Candidatus Bathyarchaeota archaeon]